MKMVLEEHSAQRELKYRSDNPNSLIMKSMIIFAALCAMAWAQYFEIPYTKNAYRTLDGRIIDPTDLERARAYFFASFAASGGAGSSNAKPLSSVPTYFIHIPSEPATPVAVEPPSPPPAPKPDTPLRGATRIIHISQPAYSEKPATVAFIPEEKPVSGHATRIVHIVADPAPGLA